MTSSPVKAVILTIVGTGLFALAVVALCDHYDPLPPPLPKTDEQDKMIEWAQSLKWQECHDSAFPQKP